jgi:TP901 family phage tail tape measure protein
MAQATVGTVNVVLGLDSKPLIAGVKAAQKTVETLSDSFDKIGQDASAGATKAEKAVQKVAQQTKQSLSKVEQAYAKASYGVDEFGLAYHQMAQKVARDSKKIEQASDSASRVGNKFTDMGSKMTSVGTKMSMALTAPMLLAGGQAIKTANDFEFSMQSIVAMVGLSEDKVADMGIAAREMAKQYGGSAVQAADALYFVASAGIDGATAMTVLEQSLKASAIGMGDTSIIADTVSSALNAYGIENLSAAAATDLMVAAVREGKMEADQLAGALPRVLPIASAMGVSFNEVGAAFAAMSRNGTDASEAATQIRGILGSLLTPTKEAEETMNSLGLSSQGLRQQIKEKGLLSALQTLTTAFGDNEQAQGLVFGNVRALTGIMSMFGAATESTTKIFDNLADNTGDADKAFQAMSSTGAFKMKQVMAEVKDAFISLGQVLVPIVVPALKMVATAFEKVMTAINALPNFMKTIIVVLAGLVAVGGPLLIMLGSLAKAWLALKAAMATQAFATAIAQFAAAGPILAGVAVAVVAVAAVWYSFSKNAQEAKDRQEDLTSALADAGDEAATLTTRVSALIEEYDLLRGKAQDNPLGANSGAEAFVLAELGAQGLSQAIADAGLTISNVTAATQDGTDSFAYYAKEMKTNTDTATQSQFQMEDMLRVLDDLGIANNTVAGSLINQYRAGKLNGTQLIASITALDEVADAFDDNREKLEENAKSLLTNTETVQGLSNILGAEFLNSLMAASMAEAEAAGNADVYQYTLEKVRVAADSVLNSLRPVTDAMVAEAQAATVSTNGLVQLNGVMNLLRLSSEDGKIGMLEVADSLKVVAQVAGNEMQMALINAQSASDTLTSSFADLGEGGREVELVVRKQMSEMVKLIGTVTSLGGKAEDVVPTLVRMYNNLLSNAEAAGYSRQEILNLIDQIGILDGLSPEIVAYFTMDVSEVKAQIAQVLRMFGGVQAGGSLEGRLKERLTFLNDVLIALESKPKRTGGGGGGSSKPDTKNDFAWVEGYVKDLAGFTNELISTDFRDALISGSAKDIGKALEATLDEATRLGLDKLPQFAGFIDKIKEQFGRLGNLADLKDSLTTQLDEATKSLNKLKSTLDDTAQAAGKFDSTIAGSQAPSNTLLDQALSAQDKYDELFSKSESLKQQQSDLAKGVSDAVLQPITARNPLGNTRKLLQQATMFRDNLTALRDKGFGPDIIGQVAQAGILEGNKIAKSLLNLSSGDIAELTKMRSDIAAIGAQAGEIAGSVVFGADIANANSELDAQRSLVRTLFADAVAQARTQFDAQKTLVDGLEASLATANTQMADLVYAIQVDLYNTMFGFLAGFNGGIDKLKGAPTNANTPTVSMPTAPTVPTAPAVSAPAMPDLPIGIDFGAIGREMNKKIATFKPGQKTDFNDGPLPNGGAIVNGYYLPPGLDFSGFHADGGVTTRASLGVIGENGPEAIIPLSRMGDFGGGDTYITVNVSGTVTSERDLVEQIRQGLIRSQKSGKALII